MTRQVFLHLRKVALAANLKDYPSLEEEKKFLWVMEVETFYTKGKKIKELRLGNRTNKGIIQDKNTFFMTVENARKILLKEKL